MLRNLLLKDKLTSMDITEENIDKLHMSKDLLWVDIENPDDNDFSILRDIFKFHHLALEDCELRYQRSKVDNYKDYCFIVLNAIKTGDFVKRLSYQEIFLFIGKNYLVSVHWDVVSGINEVYKRVQDSPLLMERGIDFLFYNIFDTVVDEYFPVTDRIEERIDAIEEVILKEPKKQIQQEILLLKRNILKFRRLLTPQREVLNILLRHDFLLINEENRLYFMDVYDHVLRVFDLIDTYQDLLAGTLDLYMSQVSNRMNQIMKVLTIITTIMMPLTLITGIYGMNFQNMPELAYKNGYYIAIGVMAAIVALQIAFFKIKKWI